MSPLSDSKRSIVALALIFCSGGSFLFAQEQSATPASDQRDLFERAIAQLESTRAISHPLKDVFQRTAKAVVKIHGVDEHRVRSEISWPLFFHHSLACEPADTTRGSRGAALEHERRGCWHRGQQTREHFGVLCGADRSGGENPQRLCSFR